MKDISDSVIRILTSGWYELRKEREKEWERERKKEREKEKDEHDLYQI